MFPPAVETGQRDAPGHEKISPSELVTGGPEGEAGRPRQEEERRGGGRGDGAGQEAQAEGGGGRVQQDQQVRGEAGGEVRGLTVSGVRYETRSDYRRREELRRERETRREREVQTEYLEKSSRSDLRDKYRDSRDFSGGQARHSRHRDNDRRDRRDVSKKARERDRRYGTDSYKSRKTSSARFES